jgi:myo-inositol-1(or 4)-monophosphatase
MADRGGLDREHGRAVALDAARAAGALLLERLARLEHEPFRRKSSWRDLVTEADVASERTLVERLRAAFPGHAIEAEEEVRDPESALRPRWFLDPLDGTINFVHRLPAFAVSLGLWVDGVPEVAVVHAPLLGETFHAVRGGGAWLGERRLKVSETDELAEAVLATGFPYRLNEIQHTNLENFVRLSYLVRGMRRMGSAALDLAYVAAGRLDGFWELHLAPHDVAAGALLVREAGGIVTDVDGGESWLRGGSIVAASPALQPLIREQVEH